MESKMDRQAFSTISMKDQQEDEKEYWRNKTPHERLQAVETTRQMIYGYDPTSTRLQRVLEVVERE
jgi:hypothetical protein